MQCLKIPSSSKSEDAPRTRKQYKSRGSRSVESSRSNASVRLTSLVNIEQNMDSFALSPAPSRLSVLSDNTDIQEPRRRSWWRKLDENSREIIEVLESDKNVEPNNFLEELDIEILSQEKNKYNLDIPDSSDSESIASIVMPQRRLFTQKENQPPKNLNELIGSRKSINKQDKTKIIVDDVGNVNKNKLLQSQTRSKPVLPSGILNLTNNKISDVANESKLPNRQVRNIFGNHEGNKHKDIYTKFVGSDNDHLSINKTLVDNSEERVSIKDPVRKIFGNHSGIKRKNMFTEFIGSENMSANETNVRKSKDSEEMRSTVRNIFGNNTGTKRRNIFAEFVTPENEVLDESRALREASPALSYTTDIEMDDWKQLPSSTMMEHQLLDTIETTVKKFKLSQVKAVESSNSNTTVNKSRPSNKSMALQNTSKSSPDSVREVTQRMDMTVSQGTSNKTKKFVQNDHVIPKIVVNNESLNMVASKNNSVSNLSTKNSNITVINNSGKGQNTSNTIIAQEYNAKNQNNLHESSNKTFPKSNTNPTISTVVKSKADKEDNENNQVNIINNNEEQFDNHIIEDDVKVQNKSENVAVAREVTKNTKEIEDTNEQLEQSIGNESKAGDNEFDQPSTVDSNRDENDEIDGNKNSVDHEQEGAGEDDRNESAADDDDGKKSAVDDNDDEKESAGDEYNDGTKSAIDENDVENESAVNENNNENESTSEENDVENESVVDENDIENESALSENNDENESAVNENGDENESVVDANESVVDANESAVDENDEENESGDDKNDVENESAVDKNHVENESVVDENDDENGSAVDENDIENESDVNENDDEIESVVDANESAVDENDEENESGDDKNDVENESALDENDVENESAVDENDDENKSAVDENDDENESAVDENYDENESADDENYDENESAVEENDDENETTVDEIDDEKESAVNENEREINESAIDDNEEKEESTNEIPYGNENEINVPDSDNDENDESYVKIEKTTPQTVQQSSPEAILRLNSNHNVSYATRRSTLHTTKSIIKDLNIKTSLMPLRESTRMSDGITNSSGEGSAWDSHRTTRKTLRQTFGRDFTIRKSLRALVMEKSAKRQTAVTGLHANENSPEVNSMELGNESSFNKEGNPNVSDHEDSRQMMQAEFEMQQAELEMQKHVEELKERMFKMGEAAKKYFNNVKKEPYDPFKVPSKPIFATREKKVAKKKIKKQYNYVIPEEVLPADFLKDLKYKPPKRYQPKNVGWATKRLYRFLESKLEPHYAYRSRVRAERVVRDLYEFVMSIRRVQVAPPAAINGLKQELARLNIIRTHYDFFIFFHEYMPKELGFKVIPDLMNKLPLPRDLYGDILQDNR